MRKISLQEDEIFFTVFFLPVESYIVFFLHQTLILNIDCHIECVSTL